jgi:hypothetical protein
MIESQLVKFRTPTLFFLVFIALICPKWLYGWSSVMPTTTLGGRSSAFATHEFLNEMAYGELKKHPAVKRGIVRFPSLDEIQDHSMVDQGQNGNGPDNPRLSEYSWHWYNPERGVPESKAPNIIAKYYGDLRNTFLAQHLTDNGTSQRGTGAHEAAYTGHFIQDMTCPFHVVGIPIPSNKPAKEKPQWDSRGNLSRTSPLDKFALAVKSYAVNEEMKARIGGPYRQYAAYEWRHLLDVAFAAFNGDHKKDWFDPNYYDGNLLLPVETSGHFLYETAVEVAYKRGSSHAAEWNRRATERGYISPLWHRGIKPEDFTRAVAKETRQRMVPGSDLVFDTRIPFSSQALIVKVPYDDWWRAIQATYTLWRLSFSALYVGHKDIRLVKLPEKPGLYDVQVSVRNLEPGENATNVSVIGEIPNQKFRGNVDIPSVVPEEKQMPPWTSLGKIQLDSPKRLPGNIRLTVKGTYQKTPDAQEAIYEYPLNAIETEGEITLSDMRGWPQQKAKSYLERMGLVMDEASAGNPKSDLDQYTVESHKPIGGAVVAKGEHIHVNVYGRFVIAVPNVTKPPLSQTKATEVIKKAKLKTAIEDREADRSTPEGQVVGQNPAPGTMVIPGSEVQVWVAKHQAKPMEAPTAQVRVKSVIIVPHETTIQLDQTLRFTATVYGMNGAPLDEASLRKISFRWDVLPPSAASISANGNTAILTPREPGPLHVACIVEWLEHGRNRDEKRNAFPREARVIVLPLKESTQRTDKQPPQPPPSKADDACTRLENIFRAALASGDVKTATAILVEAKDCPFAKAGMRSLEQEKDKQCREIYGQIQAAIRNNDRYLAASLLEKGRALGCKFPESTLQGPSGTGDQGELEGRWIVKYGMIINFRKTSQNTYAGILEANPENKPCWVKPGEQWFRATRMGTNTYRVEAADYRAKMISPGNWVRDDSTRTWLWGDQTFTVNGDTAGYAQLPQGFKRIR